MKTKFTKLQSSLIRTAYIIKKADGNLELSQFISDAILEYCERLIDYKCNNSCTLSVEIEEDPF